MKKILALGLVVLNIMATSFTKNNDDKITTLADGSAILCDESTDRYMFYPATMGDWNYEFENKQHLKWAVETYEELTPEIDSVEKITIINEYQQDDGDVIYEFNDGSSALINKLNGCYSFYPSNMGDWDMELNSEQDLINAITTFAECAYGI